MRALGSPLGDMISGPCGLAFLLLCVKRSTFLSTFVPPTATGGGSGGGAPGEKSHICTMRRYVSMVVAVHETMSHVPLTWITLTPRGRPHVFPMRFRFHSECCACSVICVNATLFTELGMMMAALGEIKAMAECFKEGIDTVRELGTALKASLAIHVTASQCSSKVW